MWRVWIGLGAAWVLVTAWVAVALLQNASVAVEDGLIAEPGSTQMLVAVLSAIIFGLPGVVLMFYGWRRRGGV